jgi:putative endopeptidase
MEFDLPAKFSDLHFSLYGILLNGTPTRKQRSKLAMDNIEVVLGDAIGKKFVQTHFSEESKVSALEIVYSVKNALRYRLSTLEWMSQDTKKNALKKLERINVKIGYPDKDTDYTKLKIVSGKHFENQLNSNAFSFANMLGKLNCSTDAKRWYMTPQTINAYYNPSLNEIVFPAALLSPPFFYHNGDPAMNYGALGAIVGHELTHGFDNTGRKYDHVGNVVDWWTPEDLKNYQARVTTMVHNAQVTEILDTHINGKLTCGENIADLGGLKLAYIALQKHIGTTTDKFAGQWTIPQRFFISWAKAWAQNNKEQHQRQSLATDPHAPAVFRVNSPLSNMHEFHKAFNIKPTDKMYVPDEQLVNLW